MIYQRGKKHDFQDFSEEQLQRFILQCVLAMFAEDRELLPRDIFVSLIQDCWEIRVVSTSSMQAILMI